MNIRHRCKAPAFQWFRCPFCGQRHGPPPVLVFALLLAGCSGESFTSESRERGECPDTVRSCEPDTISAGAPDAAKPLDGSSDDVDSDGGMVPEGASDAPSGDSPSCPRTFVACVCAADTWCCLQWAASCESLGYAIGCGVCS